MSPRTLLRGLVPFGRAISGRRFSRNNARRPRRQWLAAELLESRCMLSATARLENNTSMFDRIPVIHGSQPANPGGSFVGQFFWNGSGFKSFCVEGQQSISPGLHTFPTVTSLSISGLANADLVEQFWRSYGPTTPTGFTSVTDAAAFQLGIWEIISDGPSRDLKSGSFRVGDSASPAVARAESWLNGTGTPAAGAGGSVPLHVMQHPTMQDQVIWGPLPPPSVSVKVTPTSVTEDGPQKLTYEFTASPAPTAAITVNYRIGGSAKAGSDFTGLPPGATTGTITIRAGSTSPVTLTIVPTADTEIEPNETVILTLQQGAGYALGTSVATGTITNDDLPAVTLAVSPASVTEDGTTNLVYTFTRTGPTTSALTVKYGITGTADAADYTGATPGTGKTISFDAGSATATVTIDPTVDTTPEFDETVILTLAPGSGYTVGTTTPVTGTIENGKLTLTQTSDTANTVSTPNTTGATTLYVLQDAAGVANVDATLAWTPSNSAHHDNMRWKIDGADSGNWKATAGIFSDVGAVALAWTAPATGTPNRSFTMTAWADTNGNGKLDTNEGSKNLSLVVGKAVFTVYAAQPVPGTRDVVDLDWFDLGDGGVGHSFWGTEVSTEVLPKVDTDLRSFANHQWGYYPASAVSLTATSAPATLQNDDHHGWSARSKPYVIEKFSVLQSILQFTKNTNDTPGTYDLRSNNCTTMAIAAGESGGLSIPKTFRDVVLTHWIGGSFHFKGYNPGDLGEDLIANGGTRGSGAGGGTSGK
jgi:hypothetical protein